jgi:hypothetical protein
MLPTRRTCDAGDRCKNSLSPSLVPTSNARSDFQANPAAHCHRLNFPTSRGNPSGPAVARRTGSLAREYTLNCRKPSVWPIPMGQTSSLDRTNARYGKSHNGKRDAISRHEQSGKSRFGSPLVDAVLHRPRQVMREKIPFHWRHRGHKLRYGNSHIQGKLFQERLCDADDERGTHSTALSNNILLYT